MTSRLSRQLQEVRFQGAEAHPGNDALCAVVPVEHPAQVWLAAEGGDSGPLSVCAAIRACKRGGTGPSLSCGHSNYGKRMCTAP